MRIGPTLTFGRIPQGIAFGVDWWFPARQVRCCLLGWYAQLSWDHKVRGYTL